MNLLPVRTMAVLIVLIAGQDALDSQTWLPFGFRSLLKFGLIVSCLAALIRKPRLAGDPSAKPGGELPGQVSFSAESTARVLAIFAVLVAGEIALNSCAFSAIINALTWLALTVICVFILLNVLFKREPAQPGSNPTGPGAVTSLSLPAKKKEPQR